MLQAGADAARELIATLNAPVTNLGSCVSLVAGHIDDVTVLAKMKKAIIEHQTALVEYVEEYTTNSSALADAMDDEAGEEDQLGTLFVNLLKTVWRLKALGLDGLLDGIEQSTTKQIQQYVEKLLAYAESHAVTDTYCCRSSEVLAEACLTFNESAILLDLREQIATQITSARTKGIKLSWRAKLGNFLGKKSKEAFDALLLEIPMMQGITDDKPATIQTASIVLCDNALSSFPKPSMFGEQVPEVMLQLCNQFLATHVRAVQFVRLALNMFHASRVLVAR